MEILQQFTPAAAAATAATATPRCSTLPTTATMAQLEASIAALRRRKKRLREAYDGLLLSSPIPLPFRWSDLDAHISSLQSSIDARFAQLRALEASPRPASPAAAAVSAAPDIAARHGEESSCDEDVEMEDVQQQVVEEEMAAAAAKMTPPSSTVQVKEEEAAEIAAAMVAKMAHPSCTVKVKEEPVEVSLTPLCSGASGIAAAKACATMDALADPVGKRAAGVGQGELARHGVTQPPPVPGCRPVLQQQHMASHYPVVRQQHHAAGSAVNAGDSVFRPQQHMCKPLPPPQRVGVFVPSPTNTSPPPLPPPPPKIMGSSTPPPPLPKIVGSSPPPPQSQARVGMSANHANPFPPSVPQQLTAGDYQLQKKQQQPRMGVSDPMNADGDLPTQKQHQQFTANGAPIAGERPFQERLHDQPTTVAGDLLPQQQQQKQPFTANRPNAGQCPLQERPHHHQQQQIVTTKPTNAARNPPSRRLNPAASFAINPVLRRQRLQQLQQQKMAPRPPNSSNLSQPKQEQQQDQQSKADNGTNPRNPQQPASGMAANPPNSGDPLTVAETKRRMEEAYQKLMEEERQQQIMANKHSVPVESAMAMKKIQSSGVTASQPAAAAAAAGDAAPKPAGDQQQQQGQRKGGANRRGGRGNGNKNNNYVANTNISNMTKVIVKGKGNGNHPQGKGNGINPQGNPQGKGNGINPQFNKKEPGDQNQKSKNAGQLCYRCGCRGHWSRICRTPEHLVKLYQQDRKATKAAAAANTIYVGTMTDQGLYSH